jgi:hypothetical protein
VLGHADSAFTLRVYVDPLDEGLGGGFELNLTSPEAGARTSWLRPRTKRVQLVTARQRFNKSELRTALSALCWRAQ